MRFSDDYDTEPVAKGPTVEQFSNSWRVPGRTRADLSSPKNSQALQAVQNQNSVSLSPKPIAAHRLFAPRRQHRLCHRRPVAHCLVACTANIQRLAWHKIAYRPMLLHVIQKMREHKAEFMMLTEIRNPSSCFAMVAVEDCVLLTKGSVGILLSRPCFRAWQLQGCKHYEGKSGRWMGIVLKIRGTRLGLLSGYAPHQSSADAEIIREQFFREGEDLLDDMTGVDQFLGAGDFNSHFSKNANEEFGIAGSRGLDTPSTRRAYQMVEFMASQSLSIVDRHFACHRRGTWWNASNKKWYENEVFLTKGTIGMKSISKLKTCTMAGCDHRMKILHFCLPGRRPMWTKVSPEGKDVFIDGFGVSRTRGKIRWDVARGPSEDAEKRRDRFQIEAGTRWENMGKPESWEGISAAL